MEGSMRYLRDMGGNPVQMIIAACNALGTPVVVRGGETGKVSLSADGSCCVALMHRVPRKCSVVRVTPNKVGMSVCAAVDVFWLRHDHAQRMIDWHLNEQLGP